MSCIIRVLLSNSLTQESNLKIEVDFRLSMLKPLHAKWLVESTRGKEVIAKGWKKSETVGLLDGSTILPLEGPFRKTMIQLDCNIVDYNNIIVLLLKNINRV